MREKLINEARLLLETALFFGLWIGFLILFKTLILDEYKIKSNGLGMALVGTLVLAKVVVILEHVSLGAWVRSRPAWVDVVIRTALYTIGVFIVIILEKSFEKRHAYGGFEGAVIEVFRDVNEYHVLVNTLCLAGALLTYNVLSVIRNHLGTGGLTQVFMSSPMKETKESERIEGIH